MSYNARQRHILTRLGLDPFKHLPDEGVNAQHVDGVLTWVTPKRPAIVRSGGIDWRQKPTNKAHRVRCECPLCQREMSAARLPQHLPTCKENAHRARLAREREHVMTPAEIADDLRLDEDH